MTRDELLNPTLGFSSPETEAYNDQYGTSDKVTNLQAKKQEKLNNLSAKIGEINPTTPDWVDPMTEWKSTDRSGTKYDTENLDGNKEWMGNKVVNDLTPQEKQNMLGQAYAETGIAQQKDGSFVNVSDGSPYTGAIDNRGLPEGYGWLYGYGTKGSDEDFKVGTHNATADPKDRYQGRYLYTSNPKFNKDGSPVTRMEELVGPTGVDVSKQRMALLMPSRVSDTLERIIHGNADTRDARLFTNVADDPTDDSAYYRGTKEFGTGATEAYDSIGGVFGDSRTGTDTPEELAKKYAEFKRLAGVKVNEQPKGTLQEKMLQRESAGNYKAVNDLGYVGGYQFGAQALETLGYLKKGASKQGNKVLNNPDVWTGKGGANSLEGFLGNKELQDTAFKENASYNLNQLQKNGLIDDTSSEAEINGYLAAAHLLGANGAKNLDSEDANGTKGKEYFDLGAGISTKSTPDTTSEPSLEDRMAAIRRENMGFTDRAANTGLGFATAAGLAVYDMADMAVELVGDMAGRAVSPVSETAGNWLDKNLDLGTENEKRKAVMAITGYDDSFSAEHMKKASSLYDEAVKNVDMFDPSSYKNIDASKLFSSLGEAFSDVDSTAYSLGYIVPNLLGIVGKLGTKFLSKGLQEAGEKIDAIAASNLSKAEKKKALVEIGENLSKTDKTKLFVMRNADVAVLGGMMNNNQLDEYMANNGGEEATLARMMSGWVANTLTAKLDVGFAESALKGKAPFTDYLTKMFSNTDRGTAMKIVASGMQFTGKAATAGLKEAPQEWSQSYVEAFNRVYGTTDEDGNEVGLGDAAISSVRDANIGSIYGAAGGTHMSAGGQLAKGVLTGGLVGKATNAVGSGLEGAKNLVKGTTDTVSSIRDDVKQALGGDEEVEQNLQSTGATPEERKANLESYETASNEAIAAEVSDIVSAITGQENGKVTAENAQQAADKVVQSTLDNIQAFNEDISSKSDLSDVEKEKLAGSNTHEHLSNVANLLAAMRVSGRNEEAAHLSKSLLNRMPNMVKYFGTNPEALESFTSAVVKEAVSLNSTITKDDIAKVMSSVKALADAGEINSVNLADMQKAITTAVKVGNAYKTITKAENSTSEVALDAATGERGFLTYYDGYSTAIAKGDIKAATAYAEQISNFMSIMDNKSEALSSAVTKAEAVVSKLVTEAKAKKAKDSKVNLRAEVFSNLPKEGVKVDYNTGSKQSFEINYKDVASHILDDNKELKGVYKVLDNLTSEILAMNTLYDYASRNLTGTKSKKEVKKTEPKTSTKEPKKPESVSKSSKPEEGYSGTYTEGGSDYTVDKGEDGSYILDGHSTAESVVRGMSNTAKRKSKVDLKGKPKAEEPQQSKPKTEKVVEDYSGIYRANDDPSNDVTLERLDDGNYTMLYREGTYHRTVEQVENFLKDTKYAKVSSEPGESTKAEITPKKPEKPKEVEDSLIGFYKDLENNTLDVEATGDKEKPYRYTYTKDEEGATPTVREVTEKQLKNALGGNFKKVEAVKKPAEESSEEPSVTEIEKLRKAKAEARLQAIKEATEEAKAAKSKAWEVLSKNAKTRKIFISQFSDKLGTDKSIDGMIDLISNDIKEFAEHVDTTTGPKIEVGGFTMKRDRAHNVSTKVLAKLEEMNKRIEEGCK